MNELHIIGRCSPNNKKIEYSILIVQIIDDGTLLIGSEILHLGQVIAIECNHVNLHSATKNDQQFAIKIKKNNKNKFDDKFTILYY